MGPLNFLVTEKADEIICQDSSGPRATQDGTNTPDAAAKVCFCSTLDNHWMKTEKQARE